MLRADSAAPHPHNHYVQFFQDESNVIERVCAYLGKGLESGQAGIVIATRAHRDAVARRLGEIGLDMDAAERRGQYVALDAADTLARFMKSGSPDERLFVDVVGGVLARAGSRHTGLRAFGEMVAVLWAEGKPEAALRLEQLWNGLSRIHHFSLFCAYPSTPFFASATEAQFGSICDEHSHVIPSGHGVQEGG